MDGRAGSLWHKTAGASDFRNIPRHGVANTGLKGQRMRCKRSLGGKYCREAGGEGEEVVEGFLFRTKQCQTSQCQPESSSPRAARLLTILAPEQVVYEGNQIELICQANSNQSGGERFPAFSLVELIHCCALIGRELQSGEIFSCTVRS